MPVSMSTKMNEPVLKMMNKHMKCHIVKRANFIKLFWNKYVQKNALRTEELSKCSWYIIETILKFRNNRFYKNFYSRKYIILIFNNTLLGYF